MDITLKFKVGEQAVEIDIDMTMMAGRIYRQQFSRDMVKDLAEIYRMANPSPYKGMSIGDVNYKGKSEEEILEDLVSKVDVEQMLNARNVMLDYESSERTCQILWAFAKNADDSIPSYEEWIEQFDFVLPTKELITTLYNLWAQTAQPIIEVKN